MTGETNAMKAKGQLLEGGLAPESPETEHKVLLPKSDSWSFQRLAGHTSEGLQQPGPLQPQSMRRRVGVPNWENADTTQAGKESLPLGLWGTSLCGNISPFLF